MDTATRLIGEAELYLRSISTPVMLYQMALVLGLAALAQLLHMIAAPRLQKWLRAREDWPSWRLRLGVIVIQRLRGIFFLVLIISAVWITYREAVPERSQLIGTVASIWAAWLAVSFAAQLIRYPPLRRLVMFGAAIYIGLLNFGFLDGAAAVLESLAVTLGDFRLSALGVLQAVVVTAFLFFGARLILRMLIDRISSSEDMSPSMRVLATKVLQVVFFGAVIAIGLQAMGFDLTGLAVLSGAIGLGIGFGLQKVVSNLVSGIIILLDKSVKPGDVISLGDTFGWINQLGARYVSVVTRDGREFLIPNEDLVTGQVVNWSHSDDFVRIDLTFGTSYHDDPHLVRKVAVEAAASVPRVLSERSAACHITGFGDSSVDYVLRVWIRDAEEGLASVRGGIYLALWDAFKAHGITIPFPQREVRVLNEQGAGPERASRSQPADPEPDQT